MEKMVPTTGPWGVISTDGGLSEASTQIKKEQQAVEISAQNVNQLQPPPLISPPLEGTESRFSKAWELWFQQLWKNRLGGAIAPTPEDTQVYDLMNTTATFSKYNELIESLETLLQFRIDNPIIFNEFAEIILQFKNCDKSVIDDNFQTLDAFRALATHAHPVNQISDSTTVGQNLVTAPNPSAIRFFRINADNTISELSDVDFRTAIGAGVSNLVIGITAGTACEGNDARLSDARTPTAHPLDGALHTITGKTAGHFLKALSATTFGFAAHGLTAGDVGSQPSDATLTALAALNATPGILAQTAADTFDKIALNYSAGVVSMPTITDNHDGTITVSNDGIFNLYDSSTLPSFLRTYAINGGLFTLTDGTITFLYASYNSGTPVIGVTTARDFIVNNHLMTIIPIATYLRIGNDISFLDWDHLGIGLAEKRLNKGFDTEGRFQKSLSVGGFATTDTGSNHFSVGSGRLWTVSKYLDLDAVVSQTDTVMLHYKDSGGVWQKTAVTGFNVTQYQTPTGLATLTANRYAVNWIWRKVATDRIACILLGEGDYKLIDAQSSKKPNIPTEISALGYLVSRIIVEKNAANATQIDDYTFTQPTPSGTIIHNDTSSRNAVDTHPASSITNTPYGTVAGVTVQAALNEHEDDLAAIRQAFTDTHFTSGFLSRTDNTLSLSTRTLTIAPTGANFVIYLDGVKIIKTGGASCSTTIPATVGLHYIYFDATGTLKNSMSAWEIIAGLAPVATIYWNGAAGAVADERHGAQRNLSWHQWAHDTISTRYESGLIQTFPTGAQSKIQIESGYIHDEDIDFLIAQQKLCRNWYETAASTYTWANGVDNAGNDRPYLWNAGTSRVQYPKSDAAYALTDAGANEYVVVWAYASTDVDRPIYILTASKTSAFNNIAAARAAAAPSTIGFLTPEMKLIYRWIFKGDGTFQESTDYRTSSSLPGGGTTAVNALNVSYTPTGNIAATNTQNAIDELDTEKAAVNAATTGSAGSLKSTATTGLMTITGPGTGATRVKTVRDADDTVLELGGSYTPTGTWVWTSATATWPTFNQNTTGSAALVVVADTAASACYVALFESATGSIAPKTDANIKYDASSGLMTVAYLQVNANAKVSNALLSAVNSGNDFEFGHSNASGYRSVLGAEAGSGKTFIGLHCEAGTTSNTYRTRGIIGNVIRPDLAGGISFDKAATASADNQALTNLFFIDTNGDLYLRGSKINTSSYSLMFFASKAGIADNTDTALFTITTTNETGDVDGGAYTCKIKLLIAHAATAGASAEAVVYGEYVFSRVMVGAGTGQNSAVAVLYQSASNASSAGTRDIGTITVSVSETSEYVQSVNIQVDLTGSSVYQAEVVSTVELNWYGFTHAPTIASA